MPRALTAALGLLFVLAGACTTSGPVASPEGAESATVTDESRELEALLILMSDRRLLEPIALQSALAGDAELKQRLALTLARAADPQGLPVALELLADGVPAVRRSAAFALSQIGDPTAVPALLAAVTDPDEATGRAAVGALAALEVPLSEVAEVLAFEEEAQLWRRLLPQLYRFDASDRLRLALLGLEQAGAELRRWAVYAIVVDPQPPALPSLRRLLEDPDAVVRAWAAEALGTVGEREDLEALLPLLDDGSPLVVVKVLEAAWRLIGAGAVAAPESWRPALLRLLEDGRPMVRWAALSAASHWLLDPELGEVLVERAGDEEPTRRRERELALLALSRGGDPRSEELVAKAARDLDAGVRARGVEAAGWLGAHSIVDSLAGDPSAAVRTAVLEVRLRAAQRARRVDEVARLVLGALAAAGPPEPRRAALSWLQAHPTVPYEDLIEALGEAGRRSVDLRLRATNALVARALHEPLEREGIAALLDSLIRDPSHAVRRLARASLERLGRVAPPIGPARNGQQLRTYREIAERTSATRWVRIETRLGALEARLDCPVVPMTCLNFLHLAGQGFYDGLPVSTVLPGALVVAGGTDEDGLGGPGYLIRDELSLERFDRAGVLGMVREVPDGAGSRFLITLSPQPQLDAELTAFGSVVSGLDALEALPQGERISTVREIRRTGR